MRHPLAHPLHDCLVRLLGRGNKMAEQPMLRSGMEQINMHDHCLDALSRLHRASTVALKAGLAIRVP
jgi:hypothetical protein